LVANIDVWILLETFDQDWSMLDGRPTDDNNPIAAPGNARPVTLPELRIGCAIYWFQNNYPTVLEDKRKVRFSSLYQDSESIRKFYNNVKKYGKMLKLAQSSVEEQFFKGMAPDTQLEADRIGAERPLNDLVDSLEKVEKRKAEMRLGLSNRDRSRYNQSRDVAPIQLPQISQQEPVILKPVTSHGITQEQFDQALKEQADNLNKSFQAQIQTLQDSIANARMQLQSIPQQQSVPEMQAARVNRELERLYGQDGWIPKPQSSDRVNQIAERIAKELLRKKEQKEMNDLIGGFNNLEITSKKPLRWPTKWPSETDEAMDTSDLVCMAESDDDDYEIQVVRKKSNF